METNNTNRTDAFRLTELADANVSLESFFAGATRDEPSYYVEEARTIYKATGAKIHGSLFQCDVCGARFKFGALMNHESGKTFVVGERCAQKLALGLTKSQWAAHRKMVKGLGAANVKRRATWGKLRTWLSEQPEAADALRIDRTHYILADLRKAAIRYGSLTERQRALALKLAGEIAQRAADKAAEPAAVTAPMFPEGLRMEITGVVLHAKMQDSDYGSVSRMLIAVDGPHGRQKLWGTCPEAITDARWEEGEVGDRGTLRALKGRTVTFTAKVQHGREVDFAFFKRPTKSRLHPVGE